MCHLVLWFKSTIEMFPRNIWFVFTPVWFKYMSTDNPHIPNRVKTDLFSKFGLTQNDSEISDNFYIFWCRIPSTSAKTLNELQNLTVNNQFLPHPLITDLSNTGIYSKGSLSKQNGAFLDLKLYFSENWQQALKLIIIALITDTLLFSTAENCFFSVQNNLVFKQNSNYKITKLSSNSQEAK